MSTNTNSLFNAIPSPYLVSVDGKFRAKGYPTEPSKSGLSKQECKQRLRKLSSDLSDLQRVLYAHGGSVIFAIMQE